jgi:hypothetical protein
MSMQNCFIALAFKFLLGKETKPIMLCYLRNINLLYFDQNHNNFFLLSF